MSNKQELNNKDLEKVAGGEKPTVNFAHKIGDNITIYKNKVGYSTIIVQRGIAFDYGVNPVYRVSCSTNKALENRWYVEDYYSYEDSLLSCEYPE